MINRRDFLGISAGAGAAMTLTPRLLHALQHSSASLIQRAIPSSGEMLPVISYGPRQTDGAAMKEVLRTLAENGGKVVDVLHGGPEGEKAARAAAAELGMQNRFFWTTPLSVFIPTLPGYNGPPLKPDAGAIRAGLEEKLAAFNVKKIDLVMIGTGDNVQSHLDVVKVLKKEGLVRYIGVHHLAFPPGAPMPTFGNLESLMRNEPIDFIGTDYSLADRRLEETLLPLAQERKIGVMAYFPFDRRRIFDRASSTPLPEWAAEFEARTWAQFFLKYVVSNPAVTVVRTGTTKAAHMLDNIGGGIGKLPNEAMRKRMAALVDTFPPNPPPKPLPQPAPPKGSAPVVVAAAVMDRYVGDYKYPVTGQVASIRRNGDRLLMKIQNMPEVPLETLSETRFLGPWEMVFAFQPDAQGNVSRLTVEQGPNRMLLDRM
ncbi:MAG TPA: aldo/keto reductase [Longimicrobiales bacterium]